MGEATAGCHEGVVIRLEVREHPALDVRVPSPCGGGASLFVVGVCTGFTGRFGLAWAGGSPPSQDVYE